MNETMAISTTTPSALAARKALPPYEPALDRLRGGLTAAGRRLWLAGLGALAEVAELDAASQRWVEALVERGRPIEERRRRAAARLGDRANDALTRAGRRLEERARGGIAGTLNRMGVPARTEIDRLSALVDTLAAKIDDVAAARTGHQDQPQPEVAKIAGRSKKAR